jgi:hypothetical protein
MSRQTTHLHLRVSPELLGEIDQHTTRLRIGVSAWVRRVITDALRAESEAAHEVCKDPSCPSLIVGKHAHAKTESLVLF